MSDSTEDQAPVLQTATPPAAPHCQVSEISVLKTEGVVDNCGAAATACDVPQPIGLREAFMVCLSGAVGFSLGCILFVGLTGEHGLLTFTLSHWIGYALAIAFVLLWKRYGESAIERKFDADSHHHAPAAPSSPGVRWVTSLVLVLAIEGIVELAHGPIRHEPLKIVGMFVASLVVTIPITFGWIWGSRRGPSRAWLFGGLGGVISGIMSAVLLTALFYFLGEVQPQAILTLGIFLLILVPIQAGLIGLCGGLVISFVRQRDPLPWVMLVLLILATGKFLLLSPSSENTLGADSSQISAAHADSHTKPPAKRPKSREQAQEHSHDSHDSLIASSPWVEYLLEVLKVIGWCAGLFFCSHTHRALAIQRHTDKPIVH